MKRTSWVSQVVLKTTTLVALSMVASSFSFAKLTSQSRNLLIQKFENILIQMPDSEGSKVGVTLRLADLLSERARDLSYEELKTSCVECNAGVKDRKKALFYYQQALPKLDAAMSSRVLAQMGHLYELNGESAQAEKLYQKILVGNYPEDLKVEAYVSVAEMAFKSRLFEKAIKYYDHVIASQNIRRKPLAYYRKAWSQFNLGQAKEAIAGLFYILKTPELLAKDSSAGVVAIDMEYKGEVSRDLATFLAKSPDLTMAQVEQLYSSSPVNAALSNVTYLASELENLGQVQKSKEVYKFVIAKETSPVDKINDYIHLAQLENKLGDRAQSLKNYEVVINLWKAQECLDKSCREIKSRIKNYVLDWNREEKKKASDDLLLAYQLYLQNFPSELDMNVWYAQALEGKESWQKAFDSYGKILSILKTSSESPNESALDQPGKVEKKPLISLEETLLKRIELAERLGVEDLRLRVYSQYLSDSVEKTKLDSVKYQEAYILYQQKKYPEASQKLHGLALAQTADLPLREKAADLSLDALAILKKDIEIGEWSQAYAKALPQKKSEYLNLYNKSIFNQVSSYANSNNSDVALSTLESLDIKGLSADEKVKYYKDKILLSEKLKNFPKVKEASQKLMGLPNLSASDTQFALSRLMWVAEINLDFGNAYKYLKQIKEEHLSKEDRELKLALFAELSGQSPEVHYKNYLKGASSPEKKYALAVQWITEADPKEVTLKKLKQLKPYLLYKPEIYAKLFFNASDFIEAKNESLLGAILKEKGIEKTSIHKFSEEYLFLKKVFSWDDKLAQHKLESKTQRQLAKSLKQRVKWLDQGEGYLKLALEKQYSLAPFFLIDGLAKETSRFYEDILSLPMPEGLNPNEQTQYMTLLSQQAAPHNIRSNELKAKLKEFYNNSFFEKLASVELDLTGKMKQIYGEEVSWVREKLPQEYQAQLDADIQKSKASEPEKKTMPSLAQLEGLKSQIRKDPMNPTLLSELLQMEKQRGSRPMVAYLEQRLALLQDSKANAKDKK